MNPLILLVVVGELASYALPVKQLPLSLLLLQQEVICALVLLDGSFLLAYLVLGFPLDFSVPVHLVPHVLVVGLVLRGLHFVVLLLLL